MMQIANRRVFTAFLVLLFLLDQSALAGGFRLGTASTARSSALGGSYTARADDEAAIYHNPAGLVLLDGSSLTLSGNYICLDYLYRDTTGNKHTLEKNSLVPYLAATSDFGFENLGFGLALHSRYGLGGDSAWEGGATSPRRYVVTKTQLRTSYFSPAVACNVTDDLMVGVTLSAILAKGKADRFLPPNPPGGLDGTSELDGDAVGYGGTLGLLYQASERFRFGLTYSPEVKMTIKGKLETTNQPSAGRYDAETRVTLPQMATFGVLWQATDKFSLSADVEWQDWSVNDKYFVKVERSDLNVYRPRDWDDCWDYRVGAEYLLKDDLALRAGGGYSNAVVNEETLDYSFVNTNMYWLTAGVGFDLTENTTLDLFYEHAFGNRRSVDSSVHFPSANGRYDGDLDIFSVTLTYRF